MIKKAVRVISRLLFVAILFGTLASGVASAHGEEATATPEPNPMSILQSASARLVKTDTLHFKLTIQGETFISGNQMQLLSAEGELQRPDRVSTTFKAKVLHAATVSINLITIGDKTWWTNLVSGKWEPAPKDLGYNPTILFDNQGGIGPVMGKVQNPQLLASEKIDGHECYHVHGIVPQKIIGPLTANTMIGDEITVDLWIDQKTYDLIRIQLTEPKSKEHPQPAIWTLDLSRQNEKVKIEAPA